MENKELEEMRSQLSVLSEKLENESIVSEKMLSNASKKSLSEMQKKLISRIVAMAIMTYPLIHWLLSLFFLPWCVGIIILNLYIYLKSRKIGSKSLNVADYTAQIHRMKKTYRIGRILLAIFFLSFLFLMGVGYLLIYGLSAKSFGVFCGCVLGDIFIASLYYVIDNVFVKPDVEIVLEGILKDLESK